MLSTLLVPATARARYGADAAPPDDTPADDSTAAPGDAPEPTTPDGPEPTPTTTAPAPEGPSQDEVDAMQARIDALEEQVDVLRESQAEVAQELGKEPPREVIVREVEKKDEPKTKVAAPEDVDHNRPPDYADGFHFGSYGRVVAGGDHRGRAGRDADIVARGSRLDESAYVELELRREDYWEETDSYTRIVATLAMAHPLFHYNTQFNLNAGLRNLYIEESDLGVKKLRVWAGSRMYRGDDIYLLDFWPLDNLNTLGGGAAYTIGSDLTVKVHTGVNQPNSQFFYQAVPRPRPLRQPGDTQVAILDRQKIISSAKVSNIFKVGKSGGIKPVVYGELHYTNEGQRETTPRVFEDLPRDVGFLVGAQLGLFTGKRSSHLNLVARYAQGLAAYGEFNSPTQLSPDRNSKGAQEVLLAASGNYEVGPFGLLLGSYWRSFRNASPGLDYADLAEGALILRPTVWLGKIAGVSVEGSYQAQRRGVLLEDDEGRTEPLLGQMGRVGVVPFLSPAGRGNFARPHIRFIYLATVRDDNARRLYPEHDIFAMRSVDHYFGFGAEWWFGSTSYFRD